MTSIMSSQGGSAAYSNALTQLLERSQAANSDTSTGSATAPAGPPSSIPSLASVLSSDDKSGVSAQASSSITSLLMDIQALKTGTGSDPSSSASTTMPALADTSSTTTDADASQATDPQSGRSVHGHHHHHGGAAEAAKAFSRIDADGNGSVSLDEFVAGRPKSMSEADATKIFNSIDTAGTGSISEDQFAANLKQQREAGDAQHASAAQGSMSQADMQTLAQDIVQQLTQVIQNFNNGYVDGNAYDSAQGGATTLGQ